ncbi:MAG: hypothetical protein QOG50_2825 [Actinomycetota bacterium]|jgi:hypothetical protein|nr:hypothetical protein [Actinomycetota bacterium]
MRFILKRRAPLAVVAALLMTLVWAAPASAAPALVVTPNTDLVDFQTVSVTGSGFAANSSVGLLECQTGAFDLGNCDLNTLAFPSTDATGSYTTDFVVQRLINTSAGQIDCAPSACLLFSAVDPTAADVASAPLAFDPNVPPQPRLALSMTVDPRGTVVSKTGVVTVRGTVTCNLPADVFVDVVIQQRAGRVLITGEAFVDVQCDGTTAFSASGQGFSGILKGGSAFVDATADGFNGQSSAFTEVQATIKLAGKK